MKISRQRKIVELVNERDIETQEELAQYLLQSGYEVTQATVSRDIRELKLIKVSQDDGMQKYIFLNSSADMGEKYTRILRDGFQSMDGAQNIIVLKTVSGMAMAVAAALDGIALKEVVGSIAGDDTVMCVARDNESAKIIMDEIFKIIN